MNTNVAEKKNQHTVPQFYFRRFSRDGRTIDLFNIRRRKAILNASISGQCSKAYFYGKDGKKEVAFEKLEGVASRIIAAILETNKLPDKHSKEHLELLFYILSQHNRTKHTGEEYNEEINKLWKILLKDVSDLSSVLEHGKIVCTDPTAEQLYALGTTWVFGLDLSIKIVTNRSTEAFIFSDHPVVYYNQYMENFTAASCTGLASRGLQVFFPISPRTLLHLYDPGVYRVGASTSEYCEIWQGAEALKINELQWLNALENLYYSRETTPESIESQAKRFLPRRPAGLAVVEEYRPMYPTPGIDRSLIAMRKVDLKTRLRPSFVRIRKSKKKIPLFEREQVRSPHLMAAWDEFDKQVEGGNYRPEDFLKFLARKQPSERLAQDFCAQGT